MVFNPQNILVPLAIEPEDDMALAEHAVDAACDIAEKYQSHLVLLSLATPLNPGTNAGVDVSGQIYRSLMLVIQARLTRGRATLDELKKRVEARKIPVDTKVIESPESIAHSICDMAQQLGSDLIVIGSHGRTGIKHLFLGSVAERVVHLSPVPVLLLHQQRKH